MSTIDRTKDEQTLLHRNADYIRADQGSNVALYREFLAEDFTATLPDLVFRDREEFLELIAAPRPFTGLRVLEVHVRFADDDIALVHGRVAYTTTADQTDREALYTDTYARRGDAWWCIAGEVVASGQ